MEMENILINIVEAVKHFFGMMKTHGLITNFTLNCEISDKNQTIWSLVENYLRKHLNELICELSNIKGDTISIYPNHRNGEVLHIPIKIPQPTQASTSTALLPDPKVVQICVSRSEMERRISSFMARKRKEVDEMNVQEFCSKTAVDENSPEWELQSSCARVDASHVPRYGDKSHRKVSRVENIHGPQTRPKLNIEETRIKETETSEQNSIEERLRAMESHLKLKTSLKQIPPTIYSRLQQLENRILYLEGISPDYFHTSNKSVTKSANVRQKSELEMKYQNASLTEIEQRLAELTKSAKTKKS